MKKSFLFLFAAALMAACSNGSEEPVVPSNGDTGGIAFSVAFAGSAGTRAQTDAVPPTSWSKVSSLQFFLYDASGVVRYSVATDPATGGTNPVRTFTYADVPAGTYTLAVVANAGSSKIASYIDATAATWNTYNVRSKNISTLLLKHKAGSFPSFASSLSGSGVTGGTNAAYEEPAEIFMGYADGITVTSGATTNVPQFSLTREVSLMRLRLNVQDTESGVVNTSGANGVDFTQNASIMIHRLPAQMGVQKNGGGVTATSVKNDVLCISGTDVFKTQNPTDYAPNNNILKDRFTMWRDVVVFPNNGGRTNNATPDANADANNMYYIVISGQGQTGHILADGTSLSAPATVYWAGLIRGRFTPNIIREVNLTLKSGGTTVVPTDPTEEGSLIINLGDLVPWNSNIVVEDKVL